MTFATVLLLMLQMLFRNRKLVALMIISAAANLLPAAHLQSQSSLSTGDSALGKEVFSSCAACHGLDGRGGEHAPNIATDPNVQQMSDAAIVGIIRNGIPAAGMPGFRELLDDRQIDAVFKHVRVLQGDQESGKLAGDSRRGQELFFKSGSCAECHMVGGRGGFLAADLSSYGSGHSAVSIRDAIIAPDRNLDPRQGAISVVTRSGKKYRGVIRNEDNFSLQMQTTDGSFHLLDKSDLIQITHESHSLMPSDYGTTLTHAELDDLVKFISSAKGERPQSNEQQK